MQNQKPETQGLTSPENEASRGLRRMEQTAASALDIELQKAGVQKQPGELFRYLGEQAGGTGEEPQQFTTFLSRIQRGIARNIIGTTAVLSTVAVVVGETISQRAFNPEFFTILGNTVFQWAGMQIKSFDGLEILTKTAGVLAYALYPAIVYGLASNIAVKQSETRQKRLDEIKVTLDRMREGKENLTGRVGANVQLLIGESDPSVDLLAKKFETCDIDVVGYLNDANPYFASIPNWLAVRGNYTSIETLETGAYDTAVAQIALCSAGDDCFLSSREGKPKNIDLQDYQAAGALRAINRLRKEKNLPEIPQIRLTNPKRVIDSAVAGDPDIYGAKHIEDVIDKNKTRVVDSDVITIDLLAKVHKEYLDKTGQNLPIELSTNTFRSEEYEKLLLELIKEYNGRRPAGMPELAYKQKGETRTLTIFYYDNDDATIEGVEAKWEAATKEGTAIAIFNDPDRAKNRRPEVMGAGGKYICIGEKLATAHFLEFAELVEEKKVTTLSAEQISKVKELAKKEREKLSQL